MKQIIIVAGPTASGKTKLAIDIAEKIGASVINADSLQVYKENPIISAQPSLNERRGIDHFLFGYISGIEDYQIARWLRDVKKIIEESKNSLVIVGGTGFYIKHLLYGLAEIPEIPFAARNMAREMQVAMGNQKFHKLLEELDPEAAKIIDPNSYKRVLRAYEVVKYTGKSILTWQLDSKNFAMNLDNIKMVVIAPERESLYKLINERFINMLNNGAIDEVKNIINLNCNPLQGIMKSHGVPEIISYLKGEITLQEATQKAQQAVRNYAKRQTTWFKHQFNDEKLRKIVISAPDLYQVQSFIF